MSNCGCPKPCSCPCPPPGSSAAFLLCDCINPDTCVQFVRFFMQDGTRRDRTLDGQTYVPFGTVAPCTQDQLDGCSTTTPVSVVTLCRADGTPIAVVVQRDCDGTVSAPGWVNLATGVHTAGPIPVDAEPCDTNTETAGSAGRIVLCDCTPAGCVGFLRAIDAAGNVTDTTITGTPYTPAGTVGVCDLVGPIAATGLALADGTPITVVTQRDANGVTQTGWVNALTGVFTPGVPPAGTRAPGDAEPDLAVLCDVAPDGNLTPFVRQYERNRAGDITGHADHTLTGAPYTPTGTVSVCDRVAANVRNPIVLCDTLPDGTLVRFLRDYIRDENGVISGVSDTLLDGVTPYAPVGTVAECDQVAANLRDPIVLCDPLPDHTVVRFLRDYIRDIDGVITGHTDLALDGVTPYAPVGAVSVCATLERDVVILCDTLPGGEVVQFARDYIRDGDGAIIGRRDTTLDGFTPYLTTGDVALCAAAAALDVETETLCLFDQGGARLPDVVAEYGYNQATGDRTFLRFTDPTTGATVVPPAGAVARDCATGRVQVCYAGTGEGEDCAPGVQQDLDPISPTIVSATIAANPNGLTVNALDASHNGSLADWTTITTDADGAAAGLVLRYNFGSPGDISRIRLDNNYGFDVNDADGIGTATVTVFDAADTILFQGPLAAGNGAPPFFTTLGGGVIEDATYFTLSDIVRQGAPGPITIGFREIAAVGTYRSLITWECPNETITALVEGVLPGVTYDGTTVTQTNPPHTFTFSSSLGAFAIALVTDNPGAWSDTLVTEVTPTVTLNGNASLAIESVPVISRGIQPGWLYPDGTVTNVNTGEVVPDPLIVPCVAPRENDHVETAHILDMCEAGVPFLRQIRVTRDGLVRVTDTEIDGRTPYVITNAAAVTAGVCVRDRLGEVCAEMGPLPAPTLVGFGQVGDCYVAQDPNPSVTYNDPVDSIVFTAQGGIPGGPGFVLTINGVDVVGPGDFTPPVPVFPGTVGSEYTATATVGGTTITAQMVSGAMSNGGGNFGLSGRIRFEFSPQVSSVALTTNYPAGMELCDVIVLPSTASDPQQLVGFRAGDGTVTYYRADGTVVEDAVLLPCGSCCNGDAPAALAAAGAESLVVRSRARTVTPAEPWTVADLSGIPTALTAAGISGTWSVTDADGNVAGGFTASTVARWDTDGGELVPPGAITPDAGGTVAVTWTER